MLCYLDPVSFLQVRWCYSSNSSSYLLIFQQTQLITNGNTCTYFTLIHQLIYRGVLPEFGYCPTSKLVKGAYNFFVVLCTYDVASDWDRLASWALFSCFEFFGTGSGESVSICSSTPLLLYNIKFNYRISWHMAHHFTS
jgi:hypothetical protein